MRIWAVAQEAKTASKLDKKSQNLSRAFSADTHGEFRYYE